MSEVLVVQFGALQAASGDIQTALNTMNSQLNELEAAAAPLVATWDGEARTAYEQRQRKWQAAANDLAAILRDIKLAVEQSAADYMRTEQQNTRLFE